MFSRRLVTMHLRNRSFPLGVLPLVLLGALAFGQSSATNQQNQGSQPPAGQQGKVEGGVIQPIDDGSQPAQQPAAQQPATQPTAQQPVTQQPQPDPSEAPIPKSPNQPGDTVSVPAPSARGNGQNPDSEV